MGCPAVVVSISFIPSFLPSSARNVSADWGLVLGVGCKDTKSFMESANMGSFNPVENQCKELFPEYTAADYGSNTPSLLKPSWRVLAGVFFAIAVANFFA